MSNNPKVYDYKSFTIADSTTDYDVKANVTELFSNINVATRMILTTNQNVTVKLNNTLMEAFPISINDGPFQLPPNYMDIANVFITNASGNTVTIKIWLFG